MADYLHRDLQQARPYTRKRLRQVVCAPLETLTDDYLREHGWIVEAIFPPVSGLALDKPAGENSLVVVVKKVQKYHG